MPTGVGLRCPLLVAVALALPGCPAPPPSCVQPFFGDPSLPMEALPVLDVVSGTGAKLIPVSDGDQVALIPPPQGGFGLFAGARVRNLDPCEVQVRGRLRDPVTRNILKENSRPMDLAADGSGYLAPTALTSFSSVANIVACPDDLGGGVVGRSFLLELLISDRGGRTATVVRTVSPVCPADACHDECLCVCGPNYRAGMSCGPDGGVAIPDGGAACTR